VTYADRIFPPVLVLFTNTGQYRYGTGISTSFGQGPYPGPVVVLVYKSDVHGHLYYSGSNISTLKMPLVFPSADHGRPTSAVYGI